MPKKEKKKKEKKEKYFPPHLEKYKIADLAKEWDLGVVGKETSCPTQCS
jgi:hypothetical protein